ncbi:MAG: helix-turn-helix domain-containing protein, partial [Bryobacteraceae bacterium]
HDHFQMICFLSGTGQFTLGGTEYSIGPGSLFLIKPHCPHELIPTSLVKTLDVKFLVTGPNLRRLLLETGDRIDERDLGVAGLFEHIRREGEHSGYLYREMCDVFLTQILIHFLRIGSQAVSEPDAELEREPVADPVSERAVEFIRAHYAEDLDLQCIAQAAGKSDRYLRLRFEEFVGTSPMRYLLHYRIQKSKELIRHSDYALKEVAERVGFKTVHHFARAFHEFCGEAPGAWRRKYQAGISKDICIRPQFSNQIWTVRRAG